MENISKESGFFYTNNNQLKVQYWLNKTIPQIMDVLENSFDDNGSAKLEDILKIQHSINNMNLFKEKFLTKYKKYNLKTGTFAYANNNNLLIQGVDYD